VLPLSRGRAKRQGFEYYRHGTLPLYAALSTRTGAISGQTVPRHTREAFVDFSATSWRRQPRRREIHVIVDHLARGIFTSLPDLARKIRRYITRDNDDPKPIRWTYSHPAHRMTTASADAGR
jgi:hypothetical protein